MTPSCVPRAGIVAAFAAIYLLWGSTFLAIRIAVETLPPLLMAGLRWGLAGGALYLGLRMSGRPAVTVAQWGAALPGALLLIVAAHGALSWAETRLDSGVAALIVAAVPLWVVVLESVARGAHRPDRWTWLGVAAGFLGVGLLAGPGGRAELLPVLVLVAGAGAWAFGSVRAHRKTAAAPGLQGAAMQMLLGGALLLALSFLVGEPRRVVPEAVSGRSLGALFYLVVAGSVVGFSSYLWLIARVDPSRVATYAFVNPVVALLLGALVLAEPLDGTTILSAALIVAAVALVLTRRAANTGGKQEETASSVPARIKAPAPMPRP